MKSRLHHNDKFIFEECYRKRLTKAAVNVKPLSDKMLNVQFEERCYKINSNDEFVLVQH